jgi:hypothetical protein
MMGAKLGNLRNIHFAGERGRDIQRAAADSFVSDLLPILAPIQQAGGRTPDAISRELNQRHITARWGGQWHVSSVRALLFRAKSLRELRSKAFL